MTNYRRGVETERRIVEILESAGYVAQRSAGSHGPWDVVAVGPAGVRFIQAKRSKTDTGWEREYELAMEEMGQLPRLQGVSYECWVWVDRKGFVRMGVV